MSAAEKRIRVPEGMLAAVDDAIGNARAAKASRSHLSDGNIELWPNDIKTITLEAALRWQSENPPVPTLEEFDELRAHWHYNQPGQHSASIEFQRICHNWVRHMYDAPEPEPVDFDKIERYGHISMETMAEHEWVKAEDYDRLLEAFRRGQQSMIKIAQTSSLDRASNSQ
jgi:hypothetical protein